MANTLADLCTSGHRQAAGVGDRHGLVMRVLRTDLGEEAGDGARGCGCGSSAFSIGLTVHGYREGENPAQWKGHLEHLLPAQGKIAPVVHHDALPLAEVPTFIAELQERNGSAGAFEFLILTVARTSEALGATWDEFDLKACLWAVPASRMKSGREHQRAAVCPRDRDSQGSLPRTGKRPFPYSNMTFLQTLKRMKRNGITAHGFRSSFRDWAAETHDASRDVVEMALAHAVSDKTEAAYRRGDLFAKRRKLMDDTSVFCTGGADV